MVLREIAIDPFAGHAEKRSPFSKEIDEKANEKVWLEYTKVREEFQEVEQKLENADRRMEQANQYVGYVQKLAEVASKTKRLMQ